MTIQGRRVHFDLTYMLRQRAIEAERRMKFYRMVTIIISAMLIFAILSR